MIDRTKLAIGLVAVLVLLAGCAGPGGDSEKRTTPMDENASDGIGMDEETTESDGIGMGEETTESGGIGMGNETTESGGIGMGNETTDSESNTSGTV